LNSLNATVNSLTLSAQKSADALANVKAAADLTATSTFGASGAEQLGDITNIVDPQKFSQALAKAVSLGFDPSSARQVAAGARASEAIKRPDGIAFQSRRNIQGFVQRTTQDPAIQASINKQLDDLQKDVDKRNEEARKLGKAETAVVDPRDVQKILEDNLVKPSQEAADKMAEGLKANAERLNNFAASLDVYADSINKVRASQRDQLESQIKFADTLRNIRGEKKTRGDVVKEASVRQSQTLRGQTSFQGQSLIGNPQAVGKAIRQLQKDIIEGGKKIRNDPNANEDDLRLQDARQERLKDLNKALDEQISAFKDYQDVILEEIKLEKQKAAQIKAEREADRTKSLKGFTEDIAAAVAARGVIANKANRGLLTQEGRVKFAQSRGLNQEQFAELERQAGLVTNTLKKMADAGNKGAQSVLNQVDKQNALIKIQQEEIAVKRQQLGRDLTPFELKETLNVAKERQAAEEKAATTGQTAKGEEKTQELKVVEGQRQAAQKERTRNLQNQARSVGEEARQAGTASGQHSQTQAQDIQQRQANAAQQTANQTNRANQQRQRQAKRAHKDSKNVRQSNQDAIDGSDETLKDVLIRGFTFLADILQADTKVHVKDKMAHQIALAGHQTTSNGLGYVERAIVQLHNIQAAVRANPRLRGAAIGTGSVTSLALSPALIESLQDIGSLTYNKGGVVYADKGTLVNYQPKGTDTVPAMLTPGEFVVRKSSVDKYGTEMMQSINSGSFANGGKVNYLQTGGGAVFKPGLVTATTKLLSESVQNFGTFLSGGSLESFASSVNTLVSSEGFGVFSQAVNKFEQIPKEFTMTVAPTQVTVSINGAEILAQIMPEIQNEILSQTSFKIEEFRQQLKSGDV
jgi:hypothetical protein